MSIESSQEEHLLDYIHIVFQRKLLLLICLLITITIAIIVNYVTEPIYEGKAIIMIDEKIQKSPLTGVQMAYDQSLELQTHFDLIKSYPVLERVYTALYLNKADEEQVTPDKEETIPAMKKFLLFIVSNLGKAQHFLLDLLSPEEMITIPSMNDPDFWMTYKIRSLRNKIQIKNVKNTRLVDLTTSHKNPKLAQRIPNLFAQAYIEYNRSSSFEATKSSIDWLSEQLNEMKEEIRESERKFYAFKQKENIFSIKGKQTIQTQEISQLTGAYNNTKTKRLALSSTINGLRNIIDKKEYDKLATFSTSTVNNPLLENLRRDLLNGEIELSSLKNTFKFNHPQIIAVEHKIKQTREMLEQQLQKTLSSLQSEYKILKDDERSLLLSIQEYESEALDLTKKEMEYTMLEREVETNRKLYDLLFNNFTEANVIKAMPTTNIRLIEEAVYPLGPVKPRKVVNIALAVILGLTLGIGISFLLTYFDRSINTSEDVEVYLELPVLSLIPKIPDRKW